MLMVIFGAGASYDAITAFPPNSAPSFLDERLPLADELFDQRPIFRRGLVKFAEMHPIVPPLQNRGAIALEAKLQSFAEEANAFPRRHSHLMALRFYLQQIISETENDWVSKGCGALNHKTLLDRIDFVLGQDQPKLLVTFNYDLLLERSLGGLGQSFGSLSDYVASNNYKLFKLHGSVNWGRIAMKEGQPIKYELRDEAIDPHTVIKLAPALQLSEPFFVSGKGPDKANEYFLLAPAIAVPIKSKSQFECPSEHIAELTSLLPQVDRIVTIGWRATEEHFLDLLRKSLRPTRPCLVVSGGTKEANDTCENLGRGASYRFKRFDGGFTDLVASQTLDEFLRA
jgi:hypothetical protein